MRGGTICTNVPPLQILSDSSTVPPWFTPVARCNDDQKCQGWYTSEELEAESSRF